MNQELIEVRQTWKRSIFTDFGLTHIYIAMAVNIVLLYVLNNLRYMNITVITKEFTSCLWVINLSLSLSLIGNFIFLLYRPKWFFYLVQIILSALAIFAVYLVYTLFPFNLSAGNLENALKILLILVMSGSGMFFFIELGKFIRELSSMRKTPPPIDGSTQPSANENSPQ
jgi:hypothetical protein